MVKLHCYLAGFGVPDALQIESLADLVRSHLSADWSFNTAGADVYDLLLCDVDSAPGAAAWRDSATWGGIRVAATDEDTTLGDLALMKPLRVYGPGSLVHVLNEAAQLSMTPAGPGLPASGPAVPGTARPAPAPGRLRSLLRALPTWLSEPAARPPPAHVTVARTSHYGRVEVQTTDNGAPVSAPSFPLKDLFWVATLRCGGADEAAGYRDGAFSLRSWPNLASLPHAPHHIIWCSHLARQPMTAAALSKVTEHDADEAAIFLAACDELGILVRKELPPGLPPTSPTLTSRAPEHATVLRSLLNRLGLKRP